MGIKKPTHLNLWKIWLGVILIAWLTYLTLLFIVTSRGSSGDEIIFVVVSRQLFFGLIFIVINIVIYLTVRKNQKKRTIAGWVLVGVFILSAIFLSVHNLFTGTNGQSYDQFTYDEMVKLVDNCQIDHISEADSGVSEEVRDAYRRVYLKTGESKLFGTIDLSSIQEEKGHIICK